MFLCLYCEQNPAFRWSQFRFCFWDEFQYCHPLLVITSDWFLTICNFLQHILPAFISQNVPCIYSDSQPGLHHAKRSLKASDFCTGKVNQYYSKCCQKVQPEYGRFWSVEFGSVMPVKPEFRNHLVTLLRSAVGMTHSLRSDL